MSGTNTRLQPPWRAIMADLQAISAECRTKHPEIRRVADQIISRISKRGEDFSASLDAEGSSVLSFSFVTELFELLKVIQAESVKQVPAVFRSQCLILAIFQRLLSLTDQYHQRRRDSEEPLGLSQSPSNEELAFTESPDNIYCTNQDAAKFVSYLLLMVGVPRHLWEFSATDPLLLESLIGNALDLGSVPVGASAVHKNKKSDTTVRQPFTPIPISSTTTPEVEMIHLRILQVVLSSFSITSPLFMENLRTEFPFGSVTSPTVENQTYIAHCGRTIFILLTFLYNHAGTQAVQQTARAGLSQYIRFLVDSTCVYASRDATTRRMHPIVDTTRWVLERLCNKPSSADLTTEPPAETFFYYALSSDGFSIELLTVSLATLQSHSHQLTTPFLMSLVTDIIEPFLNDVVTDSVLTSNPTVCESAIQAVKKYWLLLGSISSTGISDPESCESLFLNKNASPQRCRHRLLLEILTLMEAHQVLWKKEQGVAFCHWLSKRSDFLKMVSEETALALVTGITKMAHEACFALHEAARTPASSATKTPVQNHVVINRNSSAHISEGVCRWIVPPEFCLRLETVLRATYPTANPRVVSLPVSTLSLTPQRFDSVTGEPIQNSALLSPTSQVIDNPIANVARHASSRRTQRTVTSPHAEALYNIFSLSVASVQALLSNMAAEVASCVPETGVLDLTVPRSTSDLPQQTEAPPPFTVVLQDGVVLYSCLPQPLTYEQSILCNLLEKTWGLLLSGLTVLLSATLSLATLGTCHAKALEVALQLMVMLKLFSLHDGFESSTCALIRVAFCVSDSTPFIDAASNLTTSEYPKQPPDITGINSSSLIPVRMDAHRFLLLKFLICLPQHFCNSMRIEDWQLLLPAYSCLYDVLKRRSCPSFSLVIDTVPVDSTHAVEKAFQALVGYVDNAMRIPRLAIPEDPPPELLLAEKQLMATLEGLPERSGKLCLTVGALDCLLNALCAIAHFPFSKKIDHSLVPRVSPTFSLDRNNAEPVTLSAAAHSGQLLVEVRRWARAYTNGALLRYPSTSYHEAMSFVNHSLSPLRSSVARGSGAEGSILLSCSSFFSHCTKDIPSSVKTAAPGSPDLPLSNNPNFGFALESAIRLFLHNLHVLKNPECAALVCSSLLEWTLAHSSPVAFARSGDVLHQILERFFDHPSGSNTFLEQKPTDLHKENPKEQNQQQLALPENLDSPCFDSSGLNYVMSQALVVATFVDMFVSARDSSSRQQVMDSFYNVLRVSGSKLHASEATLFWSLVAIFVGCLSAYYQESLTTIATNRSLDIPRRSEVFDGEAPTTLGETTVAEVQTFFRSLELLIEEFRDQFNEPVALFLLAQATCTFAASHSCGDSVSYTAVGLLWKLAEHVARVSDADDQQGLEHPAFPPLPVDMPAHLHARPIRIELSVVRSPPTAEGPFPDCASVALFIFEKLRRLAQDPRVDVRNCSLRSLGSAYLATVHAQRCPNNTARTGVEQILICTLSDIASSYKMLQRNAYATETSARQDSNEEATVPPTRVASSTEPWPSQQHHTRDTTLKLWDETLSTIVESVFHVISDMTLSVHGKTLDTTKGRPGDIMDHKKFLAFLERATDLLCATLECVLLDSDGATGNSFAHCALSTDVCLSALRFVTRLASLPSISNDARDIPRGTAWNILVQVSNRFWSLSQIPARPAEILAVQLTQILKQFQLCNEDPSAAVADVHSIRHCVISFRVLLLSAVSTALPTKSGRLPPPPFSQDTPPQPLHCSTTSTLPTAEVFAETQLEEHSEASTTWTTEIRSCAQRFSLSSGAANTGIFPLSISKQLFLIYTHNDDLEFVPKDLLPATTAWGDRQRTCWLSNDHDDDDYASLDLLFKSFRKRASVSSSSPQNPATATLHTLSHEMQPPCVSEIRHDSQEKSWKPPLFSSVGASVSPARRAWKYCSRPRSVRSGSHFGGDDCDITEEDKTLVRYDDDYGETPAWTTELSQHRTPVETAQLEPIIISHLFKVRRFPATSMRVTSVESLCYETLEGYFPWDTFLLSPSIPKHLWLQILEQFCCATIHPDHAFFHLSHLTQSLRALNALNRIFRRCFLAILALQPSKEDQKTLNTLGYGLAMVFSYISYLSRSRLDLSPSDLSAYCLETSLQFLCDTRDFLLELMLRDCPTSDSLPFSLEPLNSTRFSVLYEALTMGFDLLQADWTVHLPSLWPLCSDLYHTTLEVTRSFLGIKKDPLATKPLRCLPLTRRLFSSIISHVSYFASKRIAPLPLDFSYTALDSLIDVCESISATSFEDNCLSKNPKKEITEVRWRLGSVILIVHHHVRQIFNQYVIEDTESGQCPLPRQRLEEVTRVLQRLTQLKINPAFMRQPQADGCPLTHRDIYAVLAGPRAHILPVLSEVIKLIVTKDGTVRKHVINLLQDVVVANLCSETEAFTSSCSPIL